MSFANLVREGISIANSLTTTLQVTVTHYPWILDDVVGGEATYDTGVSMTALVETGKFQFRDKLSQEVQYAGTKITILGPVTDNGATNRHEPIDPRDYFVLPDGSSGPVKDVTGLVDPSTGDPYMYEVLVG